VLKKVDERLFLIGVAHILPASLSEVEEIIERERPDVVAVELCPVRYLTLTQGVRRPGIAEIARSGPRVFLLGFLLTLLQDRFSHQTGMPAGEEMLMAVRRAREVGARIELIDRDIGVTLQRLTDTMPWRERFRLFAELLMGFLPGGKRVEFKQLTEEQIVNRLLRELKQDSPTLYRVLIQERDDHMASKLVPLMSEGIKVVCVVGAGHVPGILERLKGVGPEGWGVTLRYGAGC
jgi:pheromone shutdown-related protein TraB